MSNELLNQQELNLSGVITLDGNKMPAIVHANMMAELTPEFMVMSYIMNSFNINEDKTIIDTGMYSAQGRIGYINELTSVSQKANSGDGYYRIFVVLDLENNETYIQFEFMGTLIKPVTSMNKTYEYGYQPTASGLTKGHLYDIRIENGRVSQINDYRKYSDKRRLLFSGSWNIGEEKDLGLTLEQMSKFNNIIFKPNVGTEANSTLFSYVKDAQQINIRATAGYEVEYGTGGLNGNAIVVVVLTNRGGTKWKLKHCNRTYTHSQNIGTNLVNYIWGVY